MTYTPNDNLTFRRLTSEWNQLCRSRKASGALAEWRAAEPALAGVASMADLLDHRDTADSEAANHVLEALLRIGDELATRAFVQAMLPGLVALTRYGLVKGFVGPGRTWREPSELNAELLARVWIWTGRYRGNPPEWPAAALKCHLIHVLRREADRNDQEEARFVPFDPTSHDRLGDQGVERGGIDGAMQIVCEAVEAGLLPLGYAQLLFARRIRRDPYKVISQRTGRSVDCLKQECRRAERSLARAVAA